MMPCFFSISTTCMLDGPFLTLVSDGLARFADAGHRLVQVFLSAMVISNVLPSK